MSLVTSFEGDWLRARGNIGDTVDQMILRQLDAKFKEIIGFDAQAIVGFDNESGYNQFADRITQSLDGADLNSMWAEFQAAVDLLNRQRDPLLNLMAYQVAAPVDRVLYPTEHDFEEASEYGEPKGIRIGKPFSVGFDFKWYDLAIRYTWMFLSEATADQITALNSSALEASIRLQFTKILKGIFNNVDRTTTVNDGLTAVNVYPLWNADGMVPPPYKGTTFAGSHNHYFASGAAAIVPADLQNLETTLWEHGYRITEGYRLLLLVNRQEGIAIRGFVKGTNSALYTFIPSNDVGGGVFLPANTGIVGQPDAVPPAGLTVIGTYGPWIIVEEDYVPAGYIVGLASGGEMSIGNPVGVREHIRPELRGLQLVQGNDYDYPLVDSFYRQGFGTGIRHRGASAVTQITTGGSYVIPAIYV